MSKKTLRVAKTLINVAGRNYGMGSSFYATDEEIAQAGLAKDAYEDGVEKSARRSVAGGENVGGVTSDSTTARRATAKKAGAKKRGRPAKATTTAAAADTAGGVTTTDTSAE